MAPFSQDQSLVIEVEISPVMTGVENGAVVSLSDEDRRTYLSDLYYTFVDNQTDFQEDFVSRGFPVVRFEISYGDLLNILTSTTASTIVSTTTTESNMTDLASSNDDDAGMPVGAIVGSAVAAILIVAMVVVLVMRESNRKKGKDAPAAAWNTAFEKNGEETWPVNRVSGSIHGAEQAEANRQSMMEETAIDESMMSAEAYDAENKPSYFASRSRAELVQDSLMIKRPGPGDTAYFDVSARPEENERAASLQHTNPDWQDTSLQERARGTTVLKLQPVPDIEIATMKRR